MLVLADRDSYDLAALLEVLGQLLLVRVKVYIFNEDTARVGVLFGDAFILGLVMGFRVVLV